MHKTRIFKFFRITVSATLAISMLAGDVGTSLGVAYAKETAQTTETEGEYIEEDITSSNAEQYGLAENTKDGVILHAFCWSFNAIKENMKDIAEAGFTTVQTSPANACYDSYPAMHLWDKNQMNNQDYNGENGCWWWHYQPTDWTIGNYQLGSKEDYEAMCKEAAKYGVKIITDVIPNHTARDVSKVSDNLANAAGGKGTGQLYHNNGFREIENGGEWSWGVRLACTTGMMNGLPDVNTENQGFQAYYLKYCNDLIALGCNGFRYDTAKHIGVPSDPKDSSNTRGVNDFWDVATGRKAVNGVSLNNKENLFIYGEVLQGDNVPTSEYAGYMEQTASDFGWTLRDAIRDNNFSVNTISDWKHSNPDKIVTWVESHDTYFNKHESAFLSDWQIKMGWALITARKDGTPLFFSRPDGSNAPQGDYVGNNVLGAKGNDHFKDPEVAAVNKFRTAMIGQGEYLRNIDGGQTLQIDRGTKGTCIINLGGEKTISSPTTMADGTYTDTVSGREFTVSGGTISGKLDGGKVACIYNGTIVKTPKISASPSSGASFTGDTLDVTISVTNATSASYSINGAADESFTDSKKLTIGEGVAFGEKITIKVKASNADGEAEETFTYTKKEAGKLSKNTIYFTKPSGWSGANIYAYVPGASSSDEITMVAGKWPGTAMTDEGDGVYSYTVDDSVSSCKVIFNDGKADNAQQTPTDVVGETCGYDYTSGKAYTYDSSAGWAAVDVNDATPTPEPTNTSAPTPSPTEEATPTPTQALEKIEIASSLEDGSTFNTETKEITLTLKNAQKGTYCVDDGPVKEFTGSAQVTIGKGKIADSTVTVKVTAEGNGKSEEKTFTYKKEYTASANRTAVNAAEQETVAEEAMVNAAPDTTYATNPGGQVGTKKTISSASDFDESMIIAQGIANDDQAAFRGTHEAPKFDLYAMYGAWDDTNLYIGLQYTNVIDVVDPIQGAPQQEDRKPYGPNADIPQMLVFDTGTGDYTDGTTNSTEAGQNPAWGIDVTYSGDARVDKLFLYSPRSEIVNQALFPVTNGIVDYDNAVKTGYIYINAEKGEKYSDASLPGVSITWEDGFFGSHMYGINKSGGYGGYVPADIDDPSAPWVDFLTTNHDKKHDAFNTVTIPLELLGVTAADMQSKGIGVMAVATYGESGVGCLPMDMTMLDNATEPYGKGDDSTSHEKDDSDVITAALARLGGSADITATPTKPVTNTPTPTQGGEDVTPTTEPTATPTTAATEAPTPTSIPGGEMNVNFGADRSAPQYNKTALTLKAIAKEGTAPYSYEFFIDNASVQNGANDSYTWQNGSAGAHTMKVVVTDSTGKQVTVEKAYDLEQDGDTPISATPIPEPTNTTAPSQKPSQSPTPTPIEGEPTVVPGKLSISGFKASAVTKAGDTITLSAQAADATGTPLYMFTYVLNGEEVIVKKYGTENTASFVLEEAGTYTFKVYVVDEDNTAMAEREVSGITVQQNGDISGTPTPMLTEVPKPTNTTVPTPTKAPATPTPTLKPTVTGTSKPTATPTAKPIPSITGAPKKGMRVSDPKTKSEYKVTGTGSSKTVAYDKYTGSSKTVTIPNTIVISGATYKVTTVGANAFKNNKKLKTIIIPSNVTTIGSSAFYGCTSLGKVKKGVNIKKIGDKAFYNCKSLSSITMSKKLTSIGKAAFYKCISLKKITINNKVSKIGAKAFYGCKNLKEITIRSTKLTSKNVGSSAFKGINAKAKIKVPKSKLKAYKKLLKSKGVSSKATIKKI